MCFFNCFRTKTRQSLSIFLVTLFLSSCSEQSSESGKIPLIRIDITPIMNVDNELITKDQLVLKETLPFKAIGTYSDSTQKDLTYEVTWISSDKNLAVFDNRNNSNVLSAIAPGKVKVRASMIWANKQTVSNSLDLALFDPTKKPDRLEIANPEFFGKKTTQVEIGSTLNFTARAYYPNNVVVDFTKFVTWKSSHQEQGNFSEQTSEDKNKFTAVALGNTLIRATFREANKNSLIVAASPLQIKVVAPPLTEITLSSPDLIANQTNIQLKTGQRTTFTAIGNFSNILTQDITERVSWLSDDESIASFDHQDKLNQLKAHRANTVAITAKIEGDNPIVSQPINVIITDPAAEKVYRIDISSSGMTAPQTSLQLEVGQSTDFIAEQVSFDGSKKLITSSAIWHISDDHLAMFKQDQPHTLVAKNPGKFYITAKQTFDNKEIESDPIWVEVKNSPAVTLTDLTIIAPSPPFDPSYPDNDLSLIFGNTFSFKAIAHYSNGTTEDVTQKVEWISFNAAKANFINPIKKGILYPIWQGSTLVKAKLLIDEQERISSNKHNVMILYRPSGNLLIDAIRVTYPGSVEPSPEEDPVKTVELEIGEKITFIGELMFFESNTWINVTDEFNWVSLNDEIGSFLDPEKPSTFTAKSAGEVNIYGRYQNTQGDDYIPEVKIIVVENEITTTP